MTLFELVVPMVQAIGWSLVHFVWQAVLIGMLYLVARLVLPRGNPRYVAAMLALVAMAVLPACTIWYEVRQLVQPIDVGDMLVTGTAGTQASTVAPADAATEWLAMLRAALPWLVLAWAFGVMLLGARVVRQWRGLRAIVRAAETLPDWQGRALALGQRMGLGRAVNVLASVQIATPTLVGWVRPVVVMPLAMLAHMPAEQVDLILAHELAHLRRFDHVANLFQVMLETLFFYHPVVHWISRDARNERELCCDALALRVSGGSRRDFVAALAELEEFRCDHADLVLAASGGVLVERAWFIAAGTAPPRRARLGLNFAWVALFGMAVALMVAWRQESVQMRINAILAANADVLQGKLVAQRVRLPVPFLREVVLPRQKLAPVAPVRDIQSEQTLASVVVSTPVERAARITVADLAAMPLSLQTVAVLGRSARDDTSSGVLASPRPLHTVAPVYPPQALLSGVQGQVEIRFSLNAAGVPSDLQVVHASASGTFDAAALTALSRWRFAPQADAGRHYRQTFTFRLDVQAAAGGAEAPACLVQTGTHICRSVSSMQPILPMQRPNH